jgi:hypothetical protein
MHPCIGTVKLFMVAESLIALNTTLVRDRPSVRKQTIQMLPAHPEPASRLGLIAIRLTNRLPSSA